MQNTNMLTIEYLSVKEVAGLTGTNVRTLRHKCATNRYTCRTISQPHGGKSYEILITSLEPELQEKIYKNLKDGRMLNVVPTLKSVNAITSSSNGDETTDKIIPISLKTPIKHFLEGEPVKSDVNMENNTALISLDNYGHTNYNGSNTPSYIPNSIAPISLENSNSDINHSFGVVPVESPLSVQKISEKGKNIALARVDLINLWQDYRRKQKNKSDADKEFVSTYNSKITSVKLFAILGKVSVTTLYRWAKEYKESNKNYLALMPNYNYGFENEINTSLSDEEKQTLLEIMLSPKKYSVGKAYQIIEYLFGKRGESIKSYSSYKRFIAKFKRNHYDQWVFLREGMKALKDKVAPYITRDPSLLNVGDVLVADGNVLDFQVINPYTGKPCRATLVVYMDWRSWDIAGYEIMVTENTQSIYSALRNAIIKLGKIPRICYQDNGRAFRSKFFSGVQDFEECGMNGVFQNLGIEPLFAIPYNGRSKIVERFFKEMTSSFSKMLNSYIGNNIDNKPAYMKRNEKFHKAIHSGYIPTIDEVKHYFAGWLEFHRSHKNPYNKDGKTIGQVFDEGRGNGVDIERLDELMMATEIRQIQRNGVRLFNTWYYAPELCGKFSKVAVKYSLLDISSVKIYSLAGEFICTAQTVMAVHPVAGLLGTSTDVDALKHALKQQKQAIKKTVDACKVMKASAIQKQINIIDQTPVKKVKAKKSAPKYEITCYSDYKAQDESKHYDLFSD